MKTLLEFVRSTVDCGSLLPLFRGSPAAVKGSVRGHAEPLSRKRSRCSLKSPCQPARQQGWLAKAAAGCRSPRCFALLVLMFASMLNAQEKANAINGVQGVKQEAVTSIKKIVPPTVVPVTPPPPTGVTQPVPPPPPKGVTQPTPPPATKAVNKVDGVKATPPNAVKGVPPPPAAAISTVRAVKGVQGIVAPKQLNLEAALLIKEQAKGTPATNGAEGGKGKAAAAALLNGPPGPAPAPPTTTKDGRGALQEFEKLNKPGS